MAVLVALMAAGRITGTVAAGTIADTAGMTARGGSTADTKAGIDRPQTGDFHEAVPGPDAVCGDRHRRHTF